LLRNVPYVRDRNRGGWRRASFSPEGEFSSPEIFDPKSVGLAEPAPIQFPTVARDNPMPYKVEIATYDTIPIPVPIKTGGEFFAVFRLTSLRQTTQQSLAATLNAEINGFVASGSFQGQFNNSHSDTTENSEEG
jgi:hypothetical protein